MKNNYSFTIDCHYGKFECEYTERETHDEWIINANLKNGVVCKFNCPGDWAHTMVYQFIDGIIKGMQ